MWYFIQCNSNLPPDTEPYVIQKRKYKIITTSEHGHSKILYAHLFRISQNKLFLFDLNRVVDKLS